MENQLHASYEQNSMLLCVLTVYNYVDFKWLLRDGESFLKSKLTLQSINYHWIEKNELS